MKSAGNYSKRPQKSSKQIPGPSSFLGLNAVLQLYRKKHLKFFEDLFQQYGDIVRFQFGTLKLILLAHPDHIKHVLVTDRSKYIKGKIYKEVKALLGTGIITSEEKKWKTLRDASQPFFTQNYMNSINQTMVDTIGEVSGRWEVCASKKIPVDITQEMADISSKIVSRALFGLEMHDQESEFLENFTYALNFVSERTASACPFSIRYPGSPHSRFKNAMKKIHQFISEVVSRKEEVSRLSNSNFFSALLHSKNNGEIDERMFFDQIVTIFFAGHETTSLLLTWTWYLLALNPEARTKLDNELEQVLGNNAPSHQKVHALTYTQQVLQESMRLFPPVWVFGREAVEADEIGGYQILPGDVVMLSPWITHRHPRFWSNPGQFDPERFSPEKIEVLHKFAYFPFSTGPRLCLGNHMALHESTLAIAMLAQKFQVSLLPNAKVVPVARGTLQPQEPLLMTVIKK